MTYDEAMSFAAGVAEDCAAIARECDEHNLTYGDEPVISMIESMDFGLLAEILRALMRGSEGKRQ